VSRSAASCCILCALALANLQFLHPDRVLLIGELLTFGIRNPSIPADVTTHPSIPVHLTTSYIATADCRPRYKYEPLKSSLLKPSRRASNCILLDYVQLLAPFILIFYCTSSCIYCLYTLSHIPQLSIFIAANGTYAQPGEESLFTEESRSTPRESTRIRESNQSSFPIKCLPSNYLPSCIILQMTNIADFINEAG